MLGLNWLVIGARLGSLQSLAGDLMYQMRQYVRNNLSHSSEVRALAIVDGSSA